jgi:hypothetical protein
MNCSNDAETFVILINFIKITNQKQFFKENRFDFKKKW